MMVIDAAFAIVRKKCFEAKLNINDQIKFYLVMRSVLKLKMATKWLLRYFLREKIQCT